MCVCVRGGGGGGLKEAGEERVGTGILKVVGTMQNCTKFAMYSSRKNPHPPHGRSLEIPKGREALKSQNFRSNV